LFLPLFGSSRHLKQAVCVGFKKLPATENKKKPERLTGHFAPLKTFLALLN